MYIDVSCCARCGDNHRGVEFKTFTRPSADWTYWAQCPNTGEPILLKFTHGPINLAILKEQEIKELDLEECEQCGEEAWDGRICHSCGAKDI